MHACSIVKVACQLGFLAEQLHKVLFVRIPVGNGLSCHSAFDGSLCHSSTYLCDKTRVNWFRDEVLRTEAEVVDMVNLINYIRNGLLSQVGNSMYGSHLHLLVDGLGMNVKSATEDVREADNVVNLVGIVAASGRHEHVRTACHSILVADFRHGVGKSKHDR